MNKRTNWNFESVKKYISSRDCELLSEEYINTTTNLKIKCTCGNEFYKKLKIILKGHCLCEKCVRSISAMKQTTPYNDIYNKFKEKGYTLLTKEDEYKGKSKKVKIKCDKGHIYEQIPYDFFEGHICKKCASIKNGEKCKTKYEDVKKYIESIGYKLITSENDYISEACNVEVMCDKGHVYNPTVNNLRGGARCSHCFNESRGFKNTKSYEYRCEQVEEYDYKIITPKEEYINASIEIDMLCDKGHIYKTNMYSFVNGHRCTKCNISKGENKIEKYLIDKNITYEKQYKIDNCRLKRKLPFDFAIFENNKLKCLIEYDGRQHHEIVKAFGGLDGFIGTKIHDTVKNEYCKNNNIKLIRIPYWNFNNVEEVLKQQLKL